MFVVVVVVVVICLSSSMFRLLLFLDVYIRTMIRMCLCLLLVSHILFICSVSHMTNVSIYSLPHVTYVYSIYSLS